VDPPGVLLREGSRSCVQVVGRQFRGTLLAASPASRESLRLSDSRGTLCRPADKAAKAKSAGVSFKQDNASKREGSALGSRWLSRTAGATWAGSHRINFWLLCVDTRRERWAVSAFRPRKMYTKKKRGCRRRYYSSSPRELIYESPCSSSGLFPPAPPDS